MRILFLASAAVIYAQAPANRPAAVRSAYPQRAPADPAVVERGKGFFSVQCSFCHGSDARGGEGGPNLLRSVEVLNDNKGERITPIVQSGRPDAGMPPMNLTPAQISDIAAYLHSFPVGGRDVARSKPPSIVVGNAGAGKTFFASKCASCHSEMKDLKGVATKFGDPMSLQQTWLMPGGGRGRGVPASTPPPVTARLTFADGKKVEGRLERIDDFLVTIRDSEGWPRSYPRRGEQPKVEIQDPLEGHMNLLAHYTDKDIHDVTAYLVTLK